MSNIEKYIDQIEIIKLDTDKKSFFGSISKGVVSNKRIYIYDSYNKIFIIYNEDGSPFKQFKKGKGPGEIFDFRDFCITENYLYILDFGKIHKFDIVLYKYIESYNIPKSKGLNPSDFAVFSDENYMLWNTSPDVFDESKGRHYYCYHIVNHKIKEKIFEYKMPTFSKNRFTSSSISDEFLIRPTLWDNVIYVATKNEVSPYLKLDFGNQTVSEKVYSNNKDGLTSLEGDFYKHISTVFKHKNYLFFSCVGKNRKLHQGIIDLKRMKTIDFGNYIPGTPFVFYADNEWIYGYLSVATILNKDYNNNDFAKKAIAENKELKIEDNPILFRYRLK